MIPNRRSPDKSKNKEIKRLSAKAGETNIDWRDRTKLEGGLILLGGNTLEHFRIRVAQSHLRDDMLPSFWSLVGIWSGGKEFESVPLHWREELSEVPAKNSIASCRWSDYDKPDHFPNIAILQFTDDAGLETAATFVEQLKSQRTIIDLPSLVLPWLGFVWGAGQRGNPLFDGHGVPSAAMAETVYGLAGIELTPSLAAAASCPEAIWQSARWWRQFYEETGSSQAATHEAQATSQVPTGFYVTRQEKAAAVGEEERKGKVRPRKRTR